ncbi:type II toxin-antitoxin system PemK/MazF family toxin [Spirosoma taeanense]|uniref:Type II toxin-antitoxin system PemK/MazF family toxin n=1 Tax=Spirosoma taeanense TaxID=2735870 RepID=A0A6M5Y556_9BACT|nr:type II toxin-antitoxin system PemK/MazF family toxin [Spirosoma taeanense]QJW88223.1 type II toxin-antitoxin system PemK/MazF family toxin [Spirosoma taeanense]
MVINQYDVALVSSEPTAGGDVRPPRPCVIISPNEMNRQVDTLVVAPMTVTSKSYPSRVPVRSNGHTGWVVLDQIRTVDRQQVSQVLGRLSQDETDEIKQVIKELFVD